jgi:hypothetical protein
MLSSAATSEPIRSIPDHMNQLQRTEWAREAMNLNQNLATVPSHRIATVLNDLGARIVDYLSIDVEGAELEVLRRIDSGKGATQRHRVEHSGRFPEVYGLLTASGFDYQGLHFLRRNLCTQTPPLHLGRLTCC